MSGFWGRPEARPYCTGRGVGGIVAVRVLGFRDHSGGGHVAFFQAHQLHALRGAARLPDVAGLDPDDLAVLVMIIRSESSFTDRIATTLPVLLVVFMLMTPLPPRAVRR